MSDAPQADRSRLLYQGATNLERALDQSLLGLDPDRVKRLVLFTDGNQTAGRRLAGAAAPAGAGGASVSFRRHRRRRRTDAWIEAMDLPDDVRRDEPIAVTRARVQPAAHARAPAPQRGGAGAERP